MKHFESGDRAINGDDLNAALAEAAAATKGDKGDKGDAGAKGDTGATGSVAANVVLQNQSTGALVLGHALPTSDPGVANSLWNDLGIIRVSAGA